MRMMKPPDYRVERGPDGHTCTYDGVTVKVLAHKAARCRMIRRHRISINGRPPTQVVVGEIDGVFLYVDGDQITMTRKVDV